jgi:crotonobetainyl-CoA:carnitine CoA-transferase CaiB-like acyl-CoA transferase
MSDGILQGLRVIEVAHATTEHAGRALAELGAEVFLVEPPDGSPTRARRPHVATAGPSRRSIPFLARNAGKKSAVFDPARQEDRIAFAAFAAGADALVAPLGAPLLDALPSVGGPVVLVNDDGLGASSIVPFAASGGMSSSGWPHQPPCNAPSWLALDAAGVYCAGLVLLGVWMVRQGLEPPRFTVSLREAALAGLTPWTRPLMSYGMTVAGQGAQPARLGAGPYPIYQCRDGAVRVLTSTPRQWQAWRTLLGDPETLAGEEWESAQYRAQHFDALYLIGNEITRQRTRDDLFREGQRLGLTITPVLGPADFPTDPHVRHRALFQPVTDPDLGAVRMMRAPYHFSDDALNHVPVAAPSLGAHTDEAVVRSRGGGERAEPAEPAAAPAGAPADQQDVRLAATTSGPVIRRQPPSARYPLAGIRVLELGVGAVVPEVASLMALLGAEVIKVESRRYLDFLRRGAAVAGDANASPAFNQLNLGVLSAAIDMSTDAGRAVVRRLLAHCDVVMDNMRGDVVPGWGLDYEQARRIRPDVIYLRSQGLSTGVYDGFQTFGPNLQAFSGVTAMWAHPDDPFPTGTTLNHPDHLAGKQALVPLLAALLRRERTGAGLLIDAAQFEFAASLIADKFLQEHLLPGTVPPLGNRSLDSAPHGCYPCREDDTWCAVAVSDDAEWARFGSVVAEGWVRDPRFARADGRLEHVEELDGYVAAWTRRLPAPEVESLLRAAGVPASRVVTGHDLVACERDHRGGIFAAVSHPTAGLHWYTGLPFEAAATGRTGVRRPPLLGEHTEYVLYDILGLSGPEVSDLMASGAVGH